MRGFERTVGRNGLASAVTIGKFDGVHLGHRGVLAQLGSLAAARGLQPVVVTFDRHPLSLLRPEACPEALVSNEQRAALLGGSPVSATLVLEFTRALSELSPEEFVEQILVRALDAKLVLAGADFRRADSQPGEPVHGKWRRRAGGRRAACRRAGRRRARAIDHGARPGAGD